MPTPDLPWHKPVAGFRFAVDLAFSVPKAYRCLDVSPPQKTSLLRLPPDVRRAIAGIHSLAAAIS
jgi:hypothetical protein